MSPCETNQTEFAGSDDAQSFTLKNSSDTLKYAYVEQNKPKSAAVIGGGYIGMEMAENLKLCPGLDVTVIEMARHIIAPLDLDMAGFGSTLRQKNGIRLILKMELQALIPTESHIEVQLSHGT